MALQDRWHKETGSLLSNVEPTVVLYKIDDTIVGRVSAEGSFIVGKHQTIANHTWEEIDRALRHAPDGILTLPLDSEPKLMAAGNPEAVGIKLSLVGGTDVFKEAVAEQVSALPSHTKELLEGWEIQTVDKSGGSWIGQTDPDKQLITIAERWATGEVSIDPKQVVRHEIGHAVATEIKRVHPDWWNEWENTVEPEMASHEDQLVYHRFEYLLKSPDEAFAEMFSRELRHPSDPEDQRYELLKAILPNSWRLLKGMIRPMEDNTHQEQRPTARVLIVENGKVWLYKSQFEPWTMLPGGGLEGEESSVEAAIREAKEETGLDIKVTAWIANFTDKYAVRYYFLAERVGGEPALVDADGERAVTITLEPFDVALDNLTSPYDRAALETWLESTPFPQ